MCWLCEHESLSLTFSTHIKAEKDGMHLCQPSAGKVETDVGDRTDPRLSERPTTHQVIPQPLPKPPKYKLDLTSKHKLTHSRNQ